MSTSRIPVIVLIEGLGELEAEFIRFFAPMTVDELVRKMPIEGFLASWDNAVYIVTEISRGAEKTVQKLKKGDIFYWPPGRVLGIAVVEHTPRVQTVKVGRLTSGFELPQQARQGARMRFLPR
ncbi:MAG: hypothetical protein NXY59_07810 [Aigarchaeota archaeon]|nr:hypothetical protein [Candidatus Pelearchaeum maunauluense]